MSTADDVERAAADGGNGRRRILPFASLQPRIRDDSYVTVKDVEWNWPTWLISVSAVFVSGVLAWSEGNWRRHHELGMGFANHGGMWSDLVLLSMANAVIVPHLTIDWWIAGALIVAAIASVWTHIHWYRPLSPAGDETDVVTRSRGDHMWPSHGRGSWWRDLSWAGWAHVLYVTCELTLLIGFALHDAPPDAVLLVAAIFTIHVPIGLLQPRWFLTGHIATVQEQPLLAPLLLAVWGVTLIKL
jgi:hypothetical protein